MEQQFSMIEKINQPYALSKNSNLKDFVKTINKPYPNRDYDQEIDLNQHIGWGQQVKTNEFLATLFTKRTIQLIQQKTSQYLTGIVPNKTIVPSQRIVINALQTVFQDHIPNTGDIYGKYIVVDGSKTNDYSDIVNKTISMLIQGIKTTILMEKQNDTLNIWDATLLGDFNPNGLRRHDVIKLREKRPDPMLFNMKY